MSEISKTVKYAGIYAIGVFLSRTVSFIMLPIYTRFLTPENYGTIELLTMTIDIFGLIAGIGLTAAVFRFYYKYDSEIKRRQVISTIMILLISFYMFASFVGIISSDLLGKLIIADQPNAGLYFKLIFIVFAFQVFIETPLTFIKAQQRPILFVFISVLKLILQLSFNIYFVVVLNMAVLGVLYSSLIASVVIGLILAVYTFKSVGFRFNRKIAYSLIMFGAPFILSNIGDFILTFSDRYFLKAYTDLHTVGVYSLGYKIGFILWIFPVTPIMNIWSPQRFEVVKQPNAKQINQKVFIFFNIVLITCALCISLFSHDLFRIMSEPSFWDAYKIVPVIMLAYIVQGWTVFVNFGVIYSEKTHYLAVGTMSSAVSILIFSYLLIPRFGAFGAASATLIAFYLRFSIIFYFAQKSYQLKLPWSKCLLLLSMAIVTYFISLQYHHNDVVYTTAFHAICMVLFLSGFFIFPFFKPNEKRIFFNFLKHPIQTLRSGNIVGN